MALRSMPPRTLLPTGSLSHVPRMSFPITYINVRENMNNIQVAKRLVYVQSSKTKVVIMVDPLEAKRLAAEELKRLKEQAKLKRKRQIEAINGGWAMLGLTIAVIIEGYSGKDIVSQVSGYIRILSGFLPEKIPSDLLSWFNSFSPQ